MSRLFLYTEIREKYAHIHRENSMRLLDECIDVLGEKAIVLPEKEEIMNE
jgi:hypothetical protein